MKELTQVELTTLNAYRQVFDNITRELGTVAIMQKDLDARRNKAESSLDENRAGQRDYLDSLQEKYGAGQLDLDRGLFIPAHQPQMPDLHIEIPTVPESEDKPQSKPEPLKSKTRVTNKKS
jgi:hypothetical protein